MRAVVQRVSHASVSVDGELVSEIGPGMLVLLGVSREDGEEQAEWLADNEWLKPLTASKDATSK